MKILYYDCFCGISGDMNLAALIDLGVDQRYLTEQLSKLNLGSGFELKIEKGMKNGITGTRVEVVVEYEDGESSNDRDHQHVHGHHSRNFKDIQEIIRGSGLSERVKKASLDMFQLIAEAESKIHNRPVQEVHFHEVGAVDSIVDLVGAAVALEYLDADRIISSPVQLGGGFVKCRHGVLPVPAPATVEILKGIPVKTGAVQFETTTPTGAAILAANADEFTGKIDFIIEKTGYGLGFMDFEIPNVLRVYLGRSSGDEIREEQYIIETNIDDMNPELYEYIEEKLFAAGALDVFITPIIMKKGRPAVKLSALVESETEQMVREIIFSETTSLGLRKFSFEKIMLKREFIKVKTRYGDVTVKKAYYNGVMIKYKAEYEDCRRISSENNIPLPEIYREIDKIMNTEI